METWVETWPGLCPGKLRAWVWVSVLRCLELRWASLGNCALVWVGFHGPPGVSAVVGLEVFPPPGSPSLGVLETPQVGYLVIIPIFQHIQVSREAVSPGELIAEYRDWTKSQQAAGEVAATHTFQSTLSSKDNRAAPRLSAQLSPIFSTPQWDKKHRGCQNQGSVLTSTMNFQTSKEITQNQSENRWEGWGAGADFSGTIVRRGTDATLLSRVPGGPRLLACLCIGNPQSTAVGSWPRGRVTPAGESGDCVSLTPCAWVRITCRGRPQTRS